MKTFKPYSYPNLDVSKATLDQCVAHDAAIKQIAAENMLIRAHNLGVIEEFRGLFKNRGKKKDGTDYAWFTDALAAMGQPHSQNIPSPWARDNKGCVINSNDVIAKHKVCSFETYKLTLDERNKRHAAEDEASNRKKAKEDAWITAEAALLGISMDDFTVTKDFISAVREASREKWIDENYPEGTEMDIKCCDECSTWTVGERRCECGNRRIDLTVEFIGGSEKWFAYAEAY
jgi:hypothetical protein